MNHSLIFFFKFFTFENECKSTTIFNKIIISMIKPSFSFSFFYKKTLNNKTILMDTNCTKSVQYPCLTIVMVIRIKQMNLRPHWSICLSLFSNRCSLKGSVYPKSMGKPFFKILFIFVLYFIIILINNRLISN